MLTNRRVVRVEWGDCDPAGIVYYPRYFVWFDDATSHLFEAATGMTKYQMVQKYGIVGIPMVDTRARFVVPSKFGDDITFESSVTEFKRSSFNVHHRVLKGETLALEGFETRVWVARPPDDPSAIKGVPIPQEVIDALSRG